MNAWYKTRVGSIFVVEQTALHEAPSAAEAGDVTRSFRCFSFVTCVRIPVWVHLKTYTKVATCAREREQLRAHTGQEGTNLFAKNAVLLLHIKNSPLYCWSALLLRTFVSGHRHSPVSLHQLHSSVYHHITIVYVTRFSFGVSLDWI